MRGQTDLKSMKKGVIWIENTGENLYKMLSAERGGQSDCDEV